MSLRCRDSLLLLAVLAALAALGACDREERHSRSKPLGETVPASAGSASGEYKQADPRASEYEDNAYAIAQGQRLFSWMNCVGCHAHGGGGMGPALMDFKWRYGGRIDEIAASISEGRPGGMPAWKDKLPEDQIWQLAAYVRTLSGQQRKDAVTARADTISSIPPQTQTVRESILPENSVQR